jgi:hypothetical protein
MSEIQQICKFFDVVNMDKQHMQFCSQYQGELLRLMKTLNRHVRFCNHYQEELSLLMKTLDEQHCITHCIACDSFCDYNDTHICMNCSGPYCFECWECKGNICSCGNSFNSFLTKYGANRWSIEPDANKL